MQKKDDKSLAGLRVSVIGLGRFGGGVGVTKWLCEKGAKVTVSDAASPESLTGAYLSGRESIELPASRRPITRRTPASKGKTRRSPAKRTIRRQ